MGARRGLLSLVGFLVASVVAFPVWSPPVPAAPLQLTLNCGAANGNICDSSKPCLDGVTNCRSTNGVAWNKSTLDPAMAPLASKTTGSATDIDLSAYCTGANCGSATYQLRVAVSTWSIGGTGTKHLLNAGSVAGNSTTSGPLDLQVCYMGVCDTASYPWSYQASPTDGTAPAIPLTLTQTGSATGTATLQWQTVSDASGNVQSSGMSRYSIRNASSGVEIDSLNATGPGLVLSFTAYNIGTAGGTNSCTQSGLQWTIQNAGSGLEATDQAEFCGASVTGDFTATAKVTSLPLLSDYSKIGFDARETTAVDSADAPCYFMVASAGWFLQMAQRATTGAGYRIANQYVQITNSGTPSPLPLYLLFRRTGNLWDCGYSTDGQSWTYTAQGRSVPLANTLIVGPVATPTSAGTQMSASMDQVSINNAGLVSKTISIASPTSVAVRAFDVAGNASANSVSITATPGAGGGGVTHKWHPGMYARTHTAHLNCGVNCDSQRHYLYTQTLAGNANVMGPIIWVSWKTLEKDVGNDFSDGFAWLDAEINFIKTTYPGRHIGILLDFGPYGWAHGEDNQVFPQYFVNAGCTYDENSAGASGGSTSLAWYKNNSTCRGYYKRLIAAYGARYDSEAALEFIRVQQETDDAFNNAGIPGGAADSGWEDIILASVQAFPTTLIWVPINWVGVETAAAKEALVNYYVSIGAGIGDGDTIPEPISSYPFGYDCPSTALYCVIRGLNSSIGGSTNDLCGKFVSMTSVELSEMGYGSIGGHPGLTAAQVRDVWETQRCAQYGDWEPNLNEVYDVSAATQYWGGASGELYQINNRPLTRTSKPTGFQ